MLRGSIPRGHDEAEVVDGRELQYNTAALNNQVCQDLEVVDACRGTSVGRTYIGHYAPFTGECAGEFYAGLPIYYNAEKKIYMYAIDKYPEDWSSPPLRGMIRWRMASFQTFEDKTSCRREEANIYQIDVAADGEPYNYYPTIFCFDSNSKETSGFQVSTITIICHDIVASATSNSGGSPSDANAGGSGGVSMTLIIAIAAGVVVLILAACCYYKYRKGRKRDDDDLEKGSNSKESKKQSTLDSLESESNEPAPSPFAGFVTKAKSMSDMIGDKIGDSFDSLKKSLHGDKDKDKEKDKDNKPWGSSHERKPSGMEPSKAKERPWKSDHQARNSDVKPWNSRHSKKSQRFDYDSSDDESSFADEKPLIRQMSRTPSGRIGDPPARSSRSLRPEEESAVPKGIRDMVSRIDNFLVNNFESKEPKRRPSVSPPSAINIPEQKARSRSLEPDRSNSFVNKEPSRSRSLSKERSKAEDFEKSPSRSRSSRRMDTDEKPKSTRDRSLSKERSKFSEKEPTRSRSSRAFETDEKPSRSSSKERSKADDYEKSPSRSRSSRLLDTRDEKPRSIRDRSLSKERSKADSFGEKDPSRSRSLSRERSDANDNADRGRERSRSRERSKADDFADDRRRGRSRSKERSGASDFADKDRPSKSIERSPGWAVFNDKQKEPSKPSAALPPAFAATQKPKATPLPADTIGKTKPGSKPLDASAANRTVTKNDDGSVLVTQKRTREDGAIVTTKTKYATVALARKHGIDV